MSPCRCVTSNAFASLYRGRSIAQLHALVMYAVEPLLTLPRILLPCVKHVQYLDVVYRVAVHQDVVGMGHEFMGASDSAAPVLSRQETQGVSVIYKPINQTARRRRIAFCNELGYDVKVF